MQQHIRCNSTKMVSSDPKQLLLSELNRQDREESSKVDIIAGRAVDQRLGASDVYFVLDSSQRDLTTSDPEKGVFVFNIRSGGVTGENMIGISADLNDITEMEMQSWQMPVLPLYTLPTNANGSNNSIPTLIPNGSVPSGTQLNQMFGNRFIVEVKETTMQSYSNVGGSRHNFAFDLIAIGDFIYASPTSPVYMFTDPITRMDRISLVFRNPPRPIQFANDILTNTQFAIVKPDGFTFIDKGSVVLAIDIPLSAITGYSYTSGAGTLVFNSVATTLFINPAPGASIQVVQSKAYGTNALVTISVNDLVLITNAEDTGESTANGVYFLQGVDGTANKVVTLVRATHMDDTSECVKYSSVDVTKGTYLGKKFILNSTSVTDFNTSKQNWIDYSTLMMLSFYSPNHQLLENNRITFKDLNPKTLPQKIYNHLTRIEGLYIGSNVNNSDDYFRVNPDISMSEFIHTSMKNNYIVTNQKEARELGFNFIKSNQVIVVPGEHTDTVSILKTTSSTIPPINTQFGAATIVDNKEYKTLSSTYDTSAIMDKEVTVEKRYVEFEFVGDTPLDIVDTYFGILPRYSKVDFIPDLIATGASLTSGQPSTNAGWTTPLPNTFGNMTTTDGEYATTSGNFVTAAIIDVDIKDNNYVIWEYTGSSTQLIGAAFAILDQATYEAMTVASGAWARHYAGMSANENFIYKRINATSYKYSVNGGNNITVTTPPIDNIKPGGKIIVSVRKTATALLYINLTTIQDDNTILSIEDFALIVADADTWFASNKRFYLAIGDNNEKFKSTYVPINQDMFKSPMDASTLKWISAVPDTSDPYQVDTLTVDNWTNSPKVTKREGFMININTTVGGTLGTEITKNGNAAAAVAATPVQIPQNTKMNNGDYIQIQYNKSGNDIELEICTIRKNGNIIGRSTSSITVSDGNAWFADTDKRWTIISNNIKYSFKIPDTIHPYKGALLTDTKAYIDKDDAGYVNYYSDFTNIVADKSFSIGNYPLMFNQGRNRVININNSIISLSSQLDTRFNKFYQLESLDDIKTTGILLTENTLIMPNSSTTVTVPDRQFRIPIRCRRLVRRLTNLSGI